MKESTEQRLQDLIGSLETIEMIAIEMLSSGYAPDWMSIKIICENALKDDGQEEGETK